VIEPHAAPARRGRPRSESRKQAILVAAYELLCDHGLAGTSMDAVADRAGVSKATIYRWWSSKELLALDALYESWEAQAGPASAMAETTLEHELLALVLPWVGMVADSSSTRILLGILTKARDDPGFADAYRERFIQPRREGSREVLRRAIERGEVAAEVDIEVAADLVWGPLYHRLLHGHARFDEQFARRSVALAVAGIRRRP
jgi:AcrR family transcriptional regulator